MKNPIIHLALLCCAAATLSVAAAATNSANILATLRPAHPRLFATADDWNKLRVLSAEDQTLKGVLAEIERDGRELLSAPPLVYQKEGKRLMTVSLAALHRLTVWSFCHRWTGEVAFARRAEQEMLVLAAFLDWNPPHFLDTALMTAALGFGYDWLHAELAPASRVAIRKAIVEKGLREAVGPGARFSRWRRWDNNWNQICFAGLTLGALAIADEESAPARALLEAARRDIANGMRPYAPSGVYPEGPGYWSAGTSYQVLMLAALQSSLGTTWQIEDSPGFLSSAAAQLQLVGPSGLAFNFGDGGEGVQFAPAMFWFSRHLRKPELAAAQFRRLLGMLNQRGGRSIGESQLLFIALWWDPSWRADAAPELPTAWFGDGPNPVGIFRSSWTDADALYLAFKGGSADINHAHMDAGSFVLEADGVRWACDLGAQDYHSIESQGWDLWNRRQDSQRWKVYRLNNFSHSALTINGQLHRAKADARITAFDPASRHATVDLTQIFEGQATKVVRHFQVGENREVVIVDELGGLKPGVEVCWQMVTRAVVETAHNQAVLRASGKTLRARATSPADAQFTVHPADPPPDGVNEPNPGVSILTLKYRAPRDGKLQIKVALRPESR